MAIADAGLGQRIIADYVNICVCRLGQSLQFLYYLFIYLNLFNSIIIFYY